MTYSARARSLAVLLILLTGLAPILIYGWFFNRAFVLEADTALSILNDPLQNAILVDVRSREEFSISHIEGSRNWPADEIASLDAPGQIPPDLRGKSLLLICDGGFQSVGAAEKLTSLGVANAYSVKGGLQKWIDAVGTAPHTEAVRLPSGTALYKPMTLLEQTAAVVSGFGFKPMHMLLSALLAFVLLKQKAPDLRVFGWGILVFLLAEVFCAINYIFYGHNSYLAEYLHGYGMALSFGLVFFAILQGADERLVRFSPQDKPCLLLPLCRGCVKYGRASCKMRTLFQWGTGALAVLAFIPLLAAPVTSSYVTAIFGTPYSYCRLLLNQYFEGRYLPLVILLLCGGTLLVMQADRRSQAPLAARILLAGALGAFGFSLFRLALGSIYGTNLIWADFWEEVTELMFVGLAAIVVWIYRDGLLDAPIAAIFGRRAPFHGNP